jgi:hypothetical protein
MRIKLNVAMDYTLEPLKQRKPAVKGKDILFAIVAVVLPSGIAVDVASVSPDSYYIEEHACSEQTRPLHTVSTLPGGISI